MPDDCKPEFKRLDDSNYGDRKDVTMVMVQTARDNDDYLKCRVEKLADQTDPQAKKRFNPPLIDEEFSKGVVYDAGNVAYKFDDSISFGYTDEFTSLDKIDEVMTTAHVDTGLGQVTKKASLGSSVICRQCLGPWSNHHANAYWYIGYDKDAPFWLSPNWIKDPFNEEIPTVLRAITFKADATGKVDQVTLNLHGDPQAEDDLYLEIRNTVSGKPTGKILARTKLGHKNIQSPGNHAFAFDNNGPLLTKDSVYALVLRSPFTSNKNHYGIGGWGKNCKADPCPYADAWTSYDNGKHWIKHGKNENVPYKEGRYAPQDFAYTVYVKPVTPTYSTTLADEVYLEPIRTNPITRAVITPTDQQPSGSSIKYYVSKDKRTWTEVNASNSWQVNFTGTLPTILFIKAVLSTTNSAVTPILQSISIHLDTQPATYGECRCLFYNPRTTMPLGCSIWDEIGATIQQDPNTEVLIDIIKNTERLQTFAMDGSTGTVQLAELPAEPMSYVLLYKDDGSYVELTEYVHFTVNYDTGLITFLSNPASGQLKVKYYPIWMKGLTPEDFPLKCDLFQETLDCDGAKTSFTLKSIPLDPIRKVVLVDTTDNSEVELEEDIDFVVDYPNKLITTNVLYADKYNIIMKYTPELSVTGLALQYRITRQETDKQVYIKQNYYMYRV